MIPLRFIEEWKENIPWQAYTQIEQDLIISRVLVELFSDDLLKKSLAFRGGTSLSKCYNLIERFSEDIDIGVYREFLGFSGNLSKTQINDKLRRLLVCARKITVRCC